MADDKIIREQEVAAFPTTNTQFASLANLFIKELIGDNSLPEGSKDQPLGILMKNSMTFNLKVKSDSLKEEVFEKSIAEYLLSTFGIESELVDKNKPHWNVYRMFKEQKNIGKFNVDLYPNGKSDMLLITFSTLEFE